jgi:hypothetical protein
LWFPAWNFVILSLSRLQNIDGTSKGVTIRWINIVFGSTENFLRRYTS